MELDKGEKTVLGNEMKAALALRHLHDPESEPLTGVP